MPRIPDVLANSIAFLYPNVAAAKRGDSAGGTGFAIAVEAGDGGAPHEYLISNIHLVCGGCRTVRTGNGVGGFAAMEIDEALWVTHPEADDVALAPISCEELGLSAVPWANFAATQEWMVELNVGVGDETFMLGRFVAHDGRTKMQPLARFGNIALMPDPSNPVIDGRDLA